MHAHSGDCLPLKWDSLEHFFCHFSRIIQQNFLFESQCHCGFCQARANSHEFHTMFRLIAIKLNNEKGGLRLIRHLKVTHIK